MEENFDIDVEQLKDLLEGKEKINLINDANNIQISAQDGLGIENLLHSISKKINNFNIIY